MSHLLLYYQRPEPATWVFLSSFLLFGLYFVFHRFWSLRNLDLVLLVLLAPGLMMVYEGRRMRDDARPVSVGKLADQQSTNSRTIAHERLVRFQENAQQLNAQQFEEPLGSPSEQMAAPSPQKWTSKSLEFYGFVFLLAACGLLSVRMLVDPAIVRRPLLEPNLSIGGLCFIGVSLLVFLLANVIMSDARGQQVQGPSLGPGYPLLNMLPDLPTMPGLDSVDWKEAASTDNRWLPNLARIIAIVANLAIVFGIVGVGYWHFDNIKTGIGAATMYLLLPYTAQMTGNDLLGADFVFAEAFQLPHDAGDHSLNALIVHRTLAKSNLNRAHQLVAVKGGTPARLLHHHQLAQLNALERRETPATVRTRPPAADRELSSVARLSFTCVSALPQKGQRMNQELLNGMLAHQMSS